MDTQMFFQKITADLDLGKLLEEPSRVSGGLTHKMYKVVTDKAKYVVKVLNPNIMKRPDAITNFKTAEKFEEILKENNIEAIYALEFNDKKKNPNAPDEELFLSSYQALLKKFGPNGYAKFYFKDTTYEKFLKAIRNLLSDKEKFINTQRKYIMEKK